MRGSDHAAFAEEPAFSALHPACVGRLFVIVPRAVQHAVREQAAELDAQGPATLASLPPRRIERDDDVAQVAAFPQRKGEHVGGLVLASPVPVERAHLAVGHQRKRDLFVTHVEQPPASSLPQHTRRVFPSRHRDPEQDRHRPFRLTDRFQHRQLTAPCFGAPAAHPDTTVEAPVREQIFEELEGGSGSGNQAAAPFSLSGTIARSFARCDAGPTSWWWTTTRTSVSDCVQPWKSRGIRSRKPRTAKRRWPVWRSARPSWCCSICRCW